MADQSLASSLEVFLIPKVYNETSVSLPVSVIDTLADTMILGMDFLSILNIELRLHGEKLPNPKSKKLDTAVPPPLPAPTTQDFSTEKENKDLEGLLRN